MATSTYPVGRSVITSLYDVHAPDCGDVDRHYSENVYHLANGLSGYSGRARYDYRTTIEGATAKDAAARYEAANDGILTRLMPCTKRN